MKASQPILAILLFFSIGTQFVQGQNQPGQPTAAKPSVPAPALWNNFVETDFPFFSSVLDARNLGAGWPTNNLTPRGIILNLGNDCWACFDVDLLRVSAIWHGKGVTPVSMSQGSYQVAGAKAPIGQGKLPEIIGTPWIANGIYPGWQPGEQVSRIDPREPGPDSREIGRGPIDPRLGRFKAVRLRENVVWLEYDIEDVPIREWMESRVENGIAQVQRTFEIGKREKSFTLIVGSRPESLTNRLDVSVLANTVGDAPAVSLHESAGTWFLRVVPSYTFTEFSVAMSLNSAARPAQSLKAKPAELRWPEIITTSGSLSESDEDCVVDNIALPTTNPWKRNVRFADLAFFKDGRAAAVTYDGDVWLISGLRENLSGLKWKRFASGLHEPLSIAVRDEELFVFDRNGIWNLRDMDGNGEADVHRLFSNAFAQTAETREFASGMRVGPDGSFIIAKGGQQGATIGKHNGTVLRVSPDGKTTTVLGWGLRQPFMGVDPKTGLVTASDQQGHYTPATPLHVVEGNQYYGFLTGSQPKEQYPAPIADPLTWIPHSINASGAGQVWLRDARMGSMNDRLIHIGYYRPELFVTLLNDRGSRKQGAVVSLTRDFLFPPLCGAVNPVDGQLYIAGFQIWGTQAEQISGLARVRYTGGENNSTMPREIVAMKEGMLLRFDVLLDKTKATALSNFSAERWNYQRTANYGSPHFKLDGSKGQDAMFASSVYLSNDRKAVFVGIPDMQPVMQMRFGWSLGTESGKTFQQNAYFTPYELISFDPKTEGFEPVIVDLTLKGSETIAEEAPINVKEGKRVSELMGCIACHSVDGSKLGKSGPTWKGLFGSEVSLANAGKVVADAAYLRESIIDPTAKVVSGFEKSDAGMPSYEGVITDAQIESVILYIETLR
ncbi:MAG: c-type cytochrome [Verrucomicrobia bacterium]|nr:c-type cytochrome [Verrucomicrobiota bacterium]